MVLGNTCERVTTHMVATTALCLHYQGIPQT